MREQREGITTWLRRASKPLLEALHRDHGPNLWQVLGPKVTQYPVVRDKESWPKTGECPLPHTYGWGPRLEAPSQGAANLLRRQTPHGSAVVEETGRIVLLLHLLEPCLLLLTSMVAAGTS